MVGTSIVPPRAAVVIGIGTRQWMSAPSRRKKRCGLMVTNMYRSPAGPPRMPASPSPATRIRVAGEGEAGMRGGPAGDLYIFVTIRPHRFFRRDGADIHCRVPIPMTTAALGGTIEVPTIDGTIGRAQCRVRGGQYG